MIHVHQFDNCHALKRIVELDLSSVLRGGAVIFQIQPARWYSADTLLAADSCWEAVCESQQRHPLTNAISYACKSHIQ